MKRLILIDKTQFGYLTDTYMYCIHLCNYKILYICLDEGLDKVSLPNVDVIYIPKCKINSLTTILFITSAFIISSMMRGFIFLIYFPRCEYFHKLLWWRRVHVDVRTLCISDNEELNRKDLEKARKAMKCFNSVSVISNGLADKLQVKGCCTILPLGADSFVDDKKTYDNMKLLYVGVFSNRNIDQTLIGLAMYIENSGNTNVSYDIIGFGKGEDVLVDLIKEYHLEKYVILHGRKKYSELSPYFKKCNIGVSYVPIVEWFEHQPPTKTFEYTMSGLFCIATNTTANREVINDTNGILIDDNPKSFAQALLYIQENKSRINNKLVRDSLKDYTWSNITNKVLKSIIE